MSYKLHISQEIQREVGLEVGVNITAEHPFKQIKRAKLLDSLTDESSEVEKLRTILNRSDMEMVLVGYIPVPTMAKNKDDKFLFFQNDVIARDASEIIEKLEACERRKSHRSVYKRSRPWKSLGSEKEVDFIVDRENKKSVDVDVQCIYRMGHVYPPFTQRLVADARDGYIDLILKKGVFSNLERRRVDFPIQSSAKRAPREQQTDPTFPSDEWSQYLYKIEQNGKTRSVRVIHSITTSLGICPRKRIGRGRSKGRVIQIESERGSPTRANQTIISSERTTGNVGIQRG